MKDRLVQTLKGVAWGLLLLGFLHMCIACKSSKQAERVMISELEGVRVSKSNDNISLDQFLQSIQHLVANVQTNLNTDRIYYSEPDEQGKQHITAIERSQAAQTAKVEQETTQTLVNAYKRTQRSVDSLRRRLQKIEQSKEETQKTSGGVFSWSGKEAAAIMAIAVLLICAWVICRRKGFF